MVRSPIALAVTLALSSAISLATVLTALPAAAQSLARENQHMDDSFLYARPAHGGGRVPNYVADSARGQPLDYHDRRRFERPYLSGESTGLKLPTR